MRDNACGALSVVLGEMGIFTEHFCFHLNYFMDPEIYKEMNHDARVKHSHHWSIMALLAIIKNKFKIPMNYHPVPRLEY